jgi:hypothetical protein
MTYEVVPLTDAHLDHLTLPEGLDRRAYFTPGSVACAVLADGEPVFAGGIVNLQWNRGEAWILPTPFMRSHFKTCYRLMRDGIPHMALRGKFGRVQATCACGTISSLFRHLGFHHEGRMARFGPNGEDCQMWSRCFEVHP